MTDPTPGVEVVANGPLRRITLNDPARRNPLSIPLREALHDALAEAMADDCVRAVVLTGAGGTFSSGGDVGAMTGLAPLAGRERLRRLHRVIRLLIEGEKPVIAAVEGHAIGAGLSLAAACDIVVAASDVRWSGAFARVGLMPDMGSFWTLPQRMGLGRARRAMMLAEGFDTATAEAWGLVEEIVPPGEALERAETMASQVARQSPGALALTKAWLARGPLPLDAMLTAEADAQALLFGTADFAEGRAAFTEKRPPRFEGR